MVEGWWRLERYSILHSFKEDAGLIVTGLRSFLNPDSLLPRLRLNSGSQKDF